MGMTARRTAAARFVFVTMLLDWLVVGILAPVIPKLVLDFCAGQVDRASALTGIFAFAFALVQFFASPVLGLLSDRFGRRPIILLSSLGSAVDCAILALAPNVAWLFVGRVLSGATAASATACAAYIAARLPFVVAAGLMLANAAYGFFVLPESLAVDKRHSAMQWARANPLGALRLLRRHRELSGLVSSLFCSNLAVQSFSVFVIYTIYRFGWGERENGLGLALFGALSVVASIFTGRLVARLGSRVVVASGFALGTVGFILYGSAPTGLVFACALPLTGLWAIAGPPIQSAMSHRVAQTEQGELQGAIGSVRSIAMIVGPPFFSFTFALVATYGRSAFIGTPWFFGALLLVAASLLALRFMSPSPRGTTQESPAEAVANISAN